MSITCRAATAADLPALLPLVRQFYEEHQLAFTTASMQAIEALLADPQLGTVLLAVGEGAVVGYCTATRCFSVEFGGTFMLLDELFVRPECRGRGYASEVMKAAVAYARSAGAHAIRLEVESENHLARAMYERRGFAAHARVLMTCRL